MPPTPDTRLADLAQAMLDAIVARYQVNGLELPKRRYIHAGEVAYDGEQLVVTLDSTHPGMPGNETPVAAFNGGPFTLTARLDVHLLRCAPQPTGQQAAPTADALAAAGREALIDSRECVKALTSSQHTLTPLCQLFAFAGGRFVGPEGKYLGVVTSCDVQL